MELKIDRTEGNYKVWVIGGYSKVLPEWVNLLLSEAPEFFIVNGNLEIVLEFIQSDKPVTLKKGDIVTYNINTGEVELMKPIEFITGMLTGITVAKEVTSYKG